MTDNTYTSGSLPSPYGYCKHVNSCIIYWPNIF